MQLFLGYTLQLFAVSVRLGDVVDTVIHVHTSILLTSDASTDVDVERK